MNGIPIRLEIDGEEETVLLSTVRTGEKGKKLKALKRKYRRLLLTVAEAATRVKLLATEAEQDPPNRPLKQILDEQQVHVVKATEFSDDAQDAAEEIVRLALEENYAGEAEKYLNVLTDRQLHEAVEIIETGMVPKDFFQSRATRLSASGMSPSGDTRSPSSSSTDSGGATLPVGT